MSVFFIRRPDEAQLRRILERAAALPLSYPVGLAQEPVLPAGFHVGETRVTLGHGEAVFRRAVDALKRWRQFDLGWVAVFPDSAPLEPGTNVAVVASHFGFWSVHCCRIVYSLTTPPALAISATGTVPSAGDCPSNRGLSPSEGTVPLAGFAYGTLTEHAESGEEIFKVAFDVSTGEVAYHIRAVARERALLARLGYPVTRAFQARFRRDSAAAMQRHVSNHVGSRTP